MTNDLEITEVDIKEFMTFKPLQNKKYPFPDQKYIQSMIHGRKGTSKTTLSLGVPGDILVLSYEDFDNVTDPIKSFYGDDPRFQCKNFDQFFSEEDGEILKDSSNLVYDLTVKLLKIAIAKDIKFDWVLVDGFQNMATIAQMKMRYKHGVGAFAGVKNRNIWNERKIFLNEFFRLCKKVAKYGVIFASQDVSSVDDDGKYSEPSWMGKVKDDMKTIVFTSIKTRQVGSKSKNTFHANIISCKSSGLSEQLEITIKKDKEGKYISSPLHFWQKVLTTRSTVNLQW